MHCIARARWKKYRTVDSVQYLSRPWTVLVVFSLPMCSVSQFLPWLLNSFHAPVFPWLSCVYKPQSVQLVFVGSTSSCSCVSSRFLCELPLVWIILRLVYSTSPSFHVFPAQFVTEDPTKTFYYVSLSIWFPFFTQFFLLPLFHGFPRHQVHRPSLQRPLSFGVCSWVQPARHLTAFDDAALNSLFWIEANYYRPVDLPDTTGLCWREAIIRSLESIYPRSGTQPDPVPSPPSPRCAEREPEPTANGEPDSVATDEPSPRRATELRIATKPEPQGSSDQVREPTTMPATKEKATDGVCMERSSAPCTVAEGELSMVRRLCHTEEERVPLPELSPERAPVSELSPERAPVPELSPERAPVPELSPERSPVAKLSPERARVPELSPEKARIPEFRPESLEAHKFPPSHPLLPPPPLSSGSSSACPQPTIYTVRAPQDCHPPASPWSEYPLTPPPASMLRTLPRPVDTSAPPWLLAPSSPPWPNCPLAPSCSLVPLAPMSQSSCASGLHSSGCASSLHPSGSVRLLLSQFNSIQVYLYSAFYDTIVAKQLYRKLSFYNIFIYCRNLIYLTYGKIW